MRQVADHGDVDVLAAFDGDDGFFPWFAVWLEVDQAIDPGTFVRGAAKRTL
jgi:hypothetical protein